MDVHRPGLGGGIVSPHTFQQAIARNLPFSYVWGDLHQKSEGALTGMLQSHGGRKYAIRAVTFAGDTAYRSYRVRREATFRVRDESGADLTLRVCGSMIEKDGAWKVFSYVVDGD